MKKKYWIWVAALLVAVLLAGCGGAENGEVDAEEKTTGSDNDKKKSKKKNDKLGDLNIVLAGDIIEEEDRFIIEGKSNLLPGSRVVGEVLVDEGEEVFSDTTELVDEDGTFHMELNHHKYGEAEIVVRFEFEGVQEDEIKRHYGEKGQKLEGPFIYKHKVFNGILKKAEARVPYEPGAKNELTIQAPEWNELPEDYGDPRVWIEVDELTNDGEFFYLKGRSNLLEGSEIRAEYRNNRDTTQVQPDGSFAFKVDYEYLEDQGFIISFRPSNFQWNEIEEAYGEKGQKLVGNLVKSENGRQEIELVIDYNHE